MNKILGIGYIALCTMIFADHLLYAKKEKIESVTHALPSFSELTLQGRATVHLEQGNENRITITAPSHIVPLITVENVGARCSVSQNNVKEEGSTGIISFFKAIMRWIRGEPLKLFDETSIYYNIQVKNLDSLISHGAITFEEIIIQGQRLCCNFHGATRAHASVSLEYLEVRSHGNSTIMVEGKAKHQNIRSSGVLTYDSQKLEGEKVRVHSSGVPTLSFGILQKIEGKLSGVNTLSYQGNPDFSLKRSGIGKIRKNKNSNIL